MENYSRNTGGAEMKRVFRWMKGFLLILVLGAAVGFGGYRIYQGNFGGAVSVYQIDSNISTEENWNISDSMDGLSLIHI